MDTQQNYYQYDQQSSIPDHFPQPAGRIYHRQAKPAVYPVVIWTLFFGVFGIISAALRGGKAAKAGYPKGAYWLAWAITAFASYVFWSVVVRGGAPGSLDPSYVPIEY